MQSCCTTVNCIYRPINYIYCLFCSRLLLLLVTTATLSEQQPNKLTQCKITVLSSTSSKRKTLIIWCQYIKSWIEFIAIEFTIDFLYYTVMIQLGHRESMIQHTGRDPQFTVKLEESTQGNWLSNTIPSFSSYIPLFPWQESSEPVFIQPIKVQFWAWSEGSSLLP